MSTRLFTLVLLLVCSLWTHGRADAHDEGSVSVKLIIDTKTYDPSSPTDAELKIVLCNDIGTHLDVPATYDGRTVILYGQGDSHRWESNLYPLEKVDEKKLTIATHTEHTVLSIPLRELIDPSDESKTQKTYSWDWPAHPAPPKSPMHVSRTNDYVEKATFWVVWKTDLGEVQSERIEIEVQLD